MAQGTELIHGLIGLIDATITLSLLSNACLGKVPVKHSLPLAVILLVSCYQLTRASQILSLDLGYNHSYFLMDLTSTSLSNPSFNVFYNSRLHCLLY